MTVYLDNSAAKIATMDWIKIKLGKVRIISTTNGTGLTKEWSWTHFKPCTKINFKRILDLNVRTKILKLLEEYDDKFSLILAINS